MPKYYKEVIGERQMYRRIALEMGEIKHSLNNSETSSAIDNCSDLSNSAVNINGDSFIVDNLSNNNALQININHNSSSEIEEEITESCQNSITDVDGCLTNNDFIVDMSSATSLNSVIKNNSEITTNLRDFAIRNKVPHSTMTDLLHVLSPFHPELPLNAKTLLKTPSKTVFKKQLDNGEYIHFGITSYLKLFLLKNTFDINLIKMSFNIDGIPIFKSSSIVFWPILGKIVNIENIKPKPFAVGVYCGSSKPTPLSSFLEDFILEVLVLLRSGLIIGNKHYGFQVHSFVCDSPARAFMKCVKSHGGYSSCDKCTVEGTYVNHRVILDSTSAPKRTDASFLAQNDEEHHTGISPLLRLNIGMVTVFPIDYMHSLCLGVMKKLLNSWVGGYPIKVRLNSRLVDTISSQLEYLRSFITYEFNRKPRSLKELPRFKATEFRTFLLYVGPCVMLKKLDPTLYDHFLLLHVAATILLSKRHIENIGCDYVEKLMNKFVKYCAILYGLEYLIYNVHTLIHLSEEAKTFGPLNEISAFDFENYLGEIKRLIRSPNKPLDQLYRRLIESNHLSLSPTKLTLSYLNEHFDGPLIENYFHCRQYNKLLNNGLLYATKSFSMKNSYCLHKNGNVLQICNILVENDKNILFVVNKFQSYQPFYEYPVNSCLLDIAVVSQVSIEFEIISFNNILTKCMLFPNLDETFVSFPLLH